MLSITSNKNNLSKGCRDYKESFTSLELVELINKFREQEGNKTPLLHKNLMAVIRDEFEEEIRELEIQRSSQTVAMPNGGTREQPVFILNLQQARQVLVRESKFVRKAVIKYIDELEKELRDILIQKQINKQNEEWKKARKIGKLTRKSETDEIKKLVEYAQKQGSQNSDKIYMIYSKLANNMIGVKKRDEATFVQINNLTLIEHIILNVIQNGMKEGKHYKDIYKDSKKAIERFLDAAYRLYQPT